MKLIQAIGAFRPQDEEGFIINNLSLEALDYEWQSVIEQIILFYKKELTDTLHSIYIRGSVATGQAIKGISDVDSFALIYSDQFIRWKTTIFQPQLEDELKANFSFINEVEANLASFHNDFHSVNPRLSMIIKTQSICVFGKSIAPTLPLFRADRMMCLNINWLEEDVKAFLKKLDMNANTLKDCQAIMKVIIRSGFELVIEKEKQFTADLYLCYLTFSKYFPAYEQKMKQALFCFLNPITEAKELRLLLEYLGNFIIKENKKLNF